MNERSAWRIVVGRLATIGLLALALGALFSTPARSLALAFPGARRWDSAIAIAFAAVVAGLVWGARRPAARWLHELATRLARWPARRVVGALVGLGLALRLAWILALPAPFTSDGRSYVHLAEELARGEAYVSESGALADWPPGYPLFLAPLVALLGDSRAAVQVANLALFGATALLGAWLARRAAGAGTAALVVLLLAVWPNLVTLCAVPSKELLLAALLPLAFCLQTAALERTGGRRAGLLVATGAVLGCGALVQPGAILLVVVFVVHLALTSRGAMSRLAGATALALGLAAVLAPWLLRNERVLGQPLLTTAGGAVFHGANHEGATGTYSPETAQPLHRGDEVAASRRHFAAGRAWIASHPLGFAALAVRKQVYFLGDDGDGVYLTLRQRGWSGLAYAAVKAVATGFWALLWAGILLAVAVRREGIAAHPSSLLVILTLLYFAAIDSVFEAGGRHHVPLAAGLALLALAALAPAAPANEGVAA
jgi:hypothetical protein